MSGVAVVGLGLAAAVVLDDEGIDHPDAWDERVADLAAFVERERGLMFEHPVAVDFLTEDEYSDAARVDEGSLTDDQRDAMSEGATVLEALGLVPVGTDLLDTTNELTDTGTLAFYDPVTERVTVRGTEMTTAVEATVVHELVHVAQDQAFDLDRPPPDGPGGGGEAFDALVEGDAARIETAYVESLSGDEQDAYWDDYAAAVDESEAGLGDVPGAVQALFAAPYALGPSLVELIAGDGGNAAVDDAFDDPPASSEHLFDPRSYFADDAPLDVDEPETPEGVRTVGEPDVLGATTLFVVLSERIDPVVAVAGADGWGGDRYVAYRDGDRTCVRADLVGDTTADTDRIAAALRSWADAGPAGAASVETVGERVALASCAGPGGGAAAAPTGASYEALGLPATRAQLAAMGATRLGLDADEAFALGECFVGRVPLDTITQANESPDPPSEVTDTVDRAIADCVPG